MMLEFFSCDFEASDADLRIGFSDGEEGEHYFVMERDEDYMKKTLPNTESIYIELDDQCWGRNGGINSVSLSSKNFAIHLNSSILLRGYKGILITFSLEDSDVEMLRNVLQKIMQGYEDRLNLID